jgi:hypothetical protein
MSNNEPEPPDQADEYIEHIRKGIVLIVEDANATAEKYPSKFKTPYHQKTIRGKARIVSIAGAVKCPGCAGSLNYAIASNGHIHAKCSTPGCLEWME